MSARLKDSASRKLHAETGTTYLEKQRKSRWIIPLLIIAILVMTVVLVRRNAEAGLGTWPIIISTSTY
jgi:t-SNARE complex subunit (syntaxin)